MRVWSEGADFRSLVLADPDIRAHLAEPDIERLFGLEHPLRHVDAIFQRVFGPAKD